MPSLPHAPGTRSHALFYVTFCFTVAHCPLCLRSPCLSKRNPPGWPVVRFMVCDRVWAGGIWWGFSLPGRGDDWCRQGQLSSVKTTNQYPHSICTHGSSPAPTDCRHSAFTVCVAFWNGACAVSVADIQYSRILESRIHLLAKSCL